MPRRSSAHVTLLESPTPSPPAGRAAGGLDQFVGRTRELSALADALAAGARLVTVAGPGGVGKTRFVRAYLETHAPAGVFCDLSDARDLDGVLAAVARALRTNVPSRDAPSAIEHVGRLLAARAATLLVLDNAEPVLEHVARAVDAWRAAAPAHAIVVTSREVLRARGEAVFELGPLGVPAPGADAASCDAVRLFYARAREARARHDDDELGSPRELAHVAQIVAALDGLPLAIELAAARLATLAPAEILAHLTRGFDLLARAPRGAPPRHATLRAALEGSWDALAPDERAALAQCAVFRGGFTLAAAEVVVRLGRAGAPDATARVHRAIERLRDCSLLRAEHAPGEPARFAMLATVRAHALERAAGPLLDAAGRRHAAHYTADAERWAEAVDRSDGARARALLARERENVIAALERALAADPRDEAAGALALRAALAVDPLLWSQGPHHLHLALLDRALARGAACDPVLRARALVARSNVHRRAGRLAAALADLQTADRLATRAKSARLRGRVARGLGALALYRGEVATARRHYERALGFHRAARDRWFEGITRIGLAAAHLRTRRVDAARAEFEDAVAKLSAAGNATYEGVALTLLGELHLDEGRRDAARECLERALALHRGAGERYFEGLDLGTLGALEDDEGRLDAAAAYYEAALAVSREFADRRTEAIDLGYLAFVRRQQGRLLEARELLRDAVAIAREIGAARHTALFLAHLGALDAAFGDHDGAAARVAEAAALLAPDDVFVAPVELQRAHVALADAERAERAGDDAAAGAARAEAQAVLTAAHRRAGGSYELRVALRILAHARGAHATVRASLAAIEPARCLTIDVAGRWFALPGGARVDCQRRRNVWRVLVALGEHRLTAPGNPLSRDALRAAGWAGEQMRDRDAANRLHVTLATLRTLGLRAALRGGAAGYYLDPELPVRLLNDGDDPAARGA